MADRDKTDMVDFLSDNLADTKNTKIVCRSGEPQEFAALSLVRPDFARSIILFGDGSDFSDANILKRTLALAKRFSGVSNMGPVIAEVNDSNNARAIADSANVITIEPAQLITRMMVQAARRGGLISVYDELLSFDGVEIYFYKDASIVGRRYEDLILSFGRASLIGIYTIEGAAKLNPLDNPEIREGDQLIVIAEDDSLITTSEFSISESNELDLGLPNIQSSVAEKVVIIGWHSWSYLFLEELDDFMGEGSVVSVFYDAKLSVVPDIAINNRYDNMRVDFTPIDTCSFKELSGIDMEGVSNVILFSYRDSLSPTIADNKSLLTLAHLRSLIKGEGLEIKVTSELQLSENRLLAIGSTKDDFIASENFVSKVLVQLSENPKLKPVLDELLTSEGSEIHLRPAQSYLGDAEEIQFSNIVKTGRERGESVIGVLYDDNSDAGYAVEMAIPKTTKVRLSVNDWVIVIAED
ncbi:MAG: hypothetical protein VXZ45_04975 [Verrucomicrobiota bacterium]|nr:hypothetical protein [Verrucomicrobiota bacterium]